MFDFWSLLLLSGAILGVFLSLTLLIHKRGNRKSNIILSSVVFIMSIFLAEYVFFRTGLAAKYRYFISASIPLAFMIGPLFYFYTRTLLNTREKISLVDTLHFIPAVICAVNIIPDVLFISGFIDNISDTDQLFYLTLSPYVYLFSAVFQTSVYVYYSLRYIKKYERSQKGSQKLISINFGWLKKLTYAFILFLCFQFIAGIVLFLLPYHIAEVEYSLSLISALIIFMTGFFSIRQPEIISGLHLNGNGKKYEKSGLNIERKEYYIKELLDYIEREKPYLNESLKLNTISEALNIPTTYLSQVINQKFGYNFFDFINEYRISEVKKRINDTSYSHYTLLGIALECGFSNKTSFIRAFKKFTGKTPSEYQKHIISEKILH